MRTPILLAALAATGLTALPAIAQTPYQANREYNRDVRQANREYRRDVRDARQDRNSAVRDWRSYRNYDYNRPERGQRYYYADRYYRDGANYQPRRLSYNDRVYAGSNGRYYCRRTDGTTGLIIGGIAGGGLGAALTSGRSETLGILLGAAGGALAGRSIDRNNVRCR